MGKWDKLRQKILLGESDANIPFDDLCHLLRRLNFRERVKGSHHIFTRDGIDEIINIQPKGKVAKTYQVAQVRDMILKYELARADD
ncbi:MAG: type II toxin-antitoxin system HicA family toxin [Verrucomicrobiota bacterium]